MNYSAARSYLWRELCTFAHPGDKLHSAGVQGRKQLTEGRHLTSQRTIRLMPCKRLEPSFR